MSDEDIIAAAWRPLAPGESAEDFARHLVTALHTAGRVIVSTAEWDDLNDQVARFQTGETYQVGHEHGSAFAVQIVDNLREENRRKDGVLDEIEACTEDGRFDVPWNAAMAKLAVLDIVTRLRAKEAP